MGKNSSLKPIRRLDAYWIRPLPALGSEQGASRERPAVIVSNDRENLKSGHVLAVFATTREKTDMPTHTDILVHGKRSTLLCEQISLVAKERVFDYIGHATFQESMDINRAVGFSLNIGVTGLKEILSYGDNPWPRGGICAVKGRAGDHEVYPAMVLSNNIGNAKSPILEIAPFVEGVPRSPLHVRLPKMPGWYLDLGKVDCVSKERVEMQKKTIPWEHLEAVQDSLELSLGLISGIDMDRRYNAFAKHGKNT